MSVVKISAQGDVEIVEEDGPVAVLDGESVIAAAHEAVAAEAVDSWALGAAYAPGDVVAHDGKLWELIGAGHTPVDPNWAPGIARSLWKQVWESGVIPEWQQPQGAHDAYPLGFQVRYDGTIWESTFDANVWEPGVFGWVEVA